MTRAFASTPLWPYLGVVLCLLWLTLVSPRLWKSGALPDRLDESPVDMDESTPHASESVAFVPVYREQATSLPSPTLAELESPRHVVAVAPPVTERVEFDPSVGDLPSLPEPEAGPNVIPEPPQPRLSPPPAEIKGPRALAKQSAEQLPGLAQPWPQATELLARIDQLSAIDQYTGWASGLRATLDQLHQAKSLGGAEAADCLKQLRQKAAEANKLAESAKLVGVQSALLRTSHALRRRLEIWERVRQALADEAVPVSFRLEDEAGVQTQLAKVQQRIAKTDHDLAWRSYLCLDELQQKIQTGTSQQRRDLARDILERMESEKLNDTQRQILAQSPFAEMAQSLRRWASEPVDYLGLLASLETHELDRDAASSQALARHYQAARWSPDMSVRKLADHLNTHYRNANVRVAISGQLINRMLPPIDPTDEDIDENILGAQVYGRSRIHTELQVRLVPDPQRWNVGLEAAGEVVSETASYSGPATFYNEALSRYLAHKQLTVEPNGVRVWRAEAQADSSDSGLTGVRTDYDRFPVLGWLARSIALDQHSQLFPSARRVAEERLAERAGERFDEQVHDRLETAEQDFEARILGPLRDLDLRPTTLDLHTTRQRLIGRYRLAGEQQMAAHTPRPRAPSDSLLSMQIHESALNNTLEQLQLEGKRTDLRDLYLDIGATFARPNQEVPDDIPEGVVVQFADSEAVRVRCDRGRVTVTLRIAELRRGSRHVWKNFSVRAHYVPEPTQRDANLVREDTIELDGQRMTSLDRIALSGIFAKALSRTRPFKLVNRRIAENKELEDLRVTQFVITGGWIGVALGPRYGADVEHLAEEPGSGQLR